LEPSRVRVSEFKARVKVRKGGIQNARTHINRRQRKTEVVFIPHFEVLD